MAREDKAEQGWSRQGKLGQGKAVGLTGFCELTTGRGECECGEARWGGRERARE